LPGIDLASIRKPERAQNPLLLRVPKGGVARRFEVARGGQFPGVNLKGRLSGCWMVFDARRDQAANDPKHVNDIDLPQEGA
jgi:hypothetical protein